mgnify:CR=1 FL=1
MKSYNKKFVYFICLVSAMGGLLFGYDWVVIGGAKPFYELYFDIADVPAMQGLAMSVALLGCLIGAMVAGMMADRYGRKPLLIISAFIFLSSAYATGAFSVFSWFLAARFLGGIGIGIASGLSPMYIAEVAPTSIRGKLVSLNQLTIVLGAHIKAAIFRDGVLQGTPTEKKVDYHRAINKPIHYNSKLYEGYMAGGTNALLDGYRGGLTYLDGRWQGYLDDLDCVIDMEEETDIHKVSIRFMQLIGPGVFQPGQVELLTSEDGENFISRGIVPTTVPADDPDLLFQEYTFDGNWKTRYIRLKAPRANPGFIFADEIVVW